MNQSSELSVYHALFDARFDEVDEVLADVPAAALLWRPFEMSPWKGPCNSLGLVVAHALSSTVYLLRRADWALERIEWKQVDGDEGREEFGPANHDPTYLRARAQRVRQFTHAALDTFNGDDLECSRPHARRPEIVFNVRREVVHALEHLSQHVGHAQLTRQLWAVHESEVR